MTKVRSNSMGFRMIQLAMLVIIAIVVSTVTWYVWKTQAKHNLKATSNSSAQQPASPVTTPQPKHTDPTTTQPQLAAGTGIKGEIFMGAATGCYSSDPNSSCGKPPHVQATIDVQSKDSTPGASSKSIATIASDTNGMFSIDLVPGTYFLIPKPLRNGQQASSQIITITSGQYSMITFMYN